MNKLSESTKIFSLQSQNTKLQKDIVDRVAVILGYYNGSRFLSEQVRSILDQSHKNLEIFIFDDHSDIEIDMQPLNLSSDELQKIHLKVRSSNIGFVSNFLLGLSEIKQYFEYFAFSDQDDIWYPEKISNALKVLTSYPSNMPVLYCGRTQIVDESGQIDLGTSPLFNKPSSFANALIQSIGGGNTMVLNKSARDLMVRSLTNLASINVVSHDWWCYQIISGAGGIVHYDPEPCLKYRQHDLNVIGSNNSRIAKFFRIKSLLGNKFRRWNDTNLKALLRNQDLLKPDHQKRLNHCIAARKSGLFKRLFLFKRAGVYRQTLLGNLGLLFGIFLNKI